MLFVLTDEVFGCIAGVCGCRIHMCSRHGSLFSLSVLCIMFTLTHSSGFPANYYTYQGLQYGGSSGSGAGAGQNRPSGTTRTGSASQPNATQAGPSGTSASDGSFTGFAGVGATGAGGPTFAG